MKTVKFDSLFLEESSEYLEQSSSLLTSPWMTQGLPSHLEGGSGGYSKKMSMTGLD